MELFEVRGTLPALNTRRGRGVCCGSGMGLGRMTSFSITHSNLHPTNHKLVISLSKAPLVLGRTTRNFGFTRLTTAQIRGKPAPSPIYYSLRYSAAPTSEWHFFPGLPSKSPETVPIWTLGTLTAHISLLRPLIRMRSKANL